MAEIVMLHILRLAGGSLVMPVPKAYIEQNQLQSGSQVELTLDGSRMTIDATSKRRYKLDELLAEMPSDNLPRVEGWDQMPSAASEAF